MTWEFAERGDITTGGCGLGYIYISGFMGEFTTFICSKTQMKKHVITKLNHKALHKHLKENGEEEYSEYFDSWGKKIRYCNAREEFISKLNKEKLTIKSKEWLVA